MNKKGSIRDYILLLAVLLIIAILIVFAFYSVFKDIFSETLSKLI